MQVTPDMAGATPSRLLGDAARYLPTGLEGDPSPSRWEDYITVHRSLQRVGLGALAQTVQTVWAQQHAAESPIWDWQVIDALAVLPPHQLVQAVWDEATKVVAKSSVGPSVNESFWDDVTQVAMIMRQQYDSRHAPESFGSDEVVQMAMSVRACMGEDPAAKDLYRRFGEFAAQLPVAPESGAVGGQAVAY